jgi:hypothetical protein
VRVCGIVACYIGPRRWESPSFQKDKLHYARTCIEKFKKHSTHIKNLYIVFNGDLPQGWETLQEENVTVVQRPNIGFSYGAWDHILRTVVDDYDFAYLTEDDYAPCEDGFDQKLIDMMTEKTGYICGLISQENNHAAVSNGMLRMEAYKKVLIDQGGFRVNPGTEYGAGEVTQFNFPLQLLQFGYKVEDSLRLYKTLFNEIHSGYGIRIFGDPYFPHLFYCILD